MGSRRVSTDTLRAFGVACVVDATGTQCARADFFPHPTVEPGLGWLDNVGEIVAADPAKPEQKRQRSVAWPSPASVATLQLRLRRAGSMIPPRLSISFSLVRRGV